MENVDGTVLRLNINNNLNSLSGSIVLKEKGVVRISRDKTGYLLSTLIIEQKLWHAEKNVSFEILDRVRQLVSIININVIIGRFKIFLKFLSISKMEKHHHS